MRNSSSARAGLPSVRRELRFIGDRIPDSNHFVQFYETEKGLLESLCSFIGEGLLAGESAIVVATSEHRRSLDEMLQSQKDTTLASVVTHSARKIDRRRRQAANGKDTKSKMSFRCCCPLLRQ